MAILWEVFRQVFTLFALMGVGFALSKRKLIDDATLKALVALLVRVVTPCLIVQAFQRPFEASRLGALGAAFAISAVVQIASIGLAAAAFPRTREGWRTLRFATVFSNAGFMGIPLEQAILGDDGVFYGAAFVVTFNLVCWSWGVCLMSGSNREISPKRIFFNPGLLGIAIGLPFFFTSTALPPVLAEPVKMLADLNTPLAMVVVGHYLAWAKYGPVLRDVRAWRSAFLRLVAVPAAVVGAFLAFRALAPGVALDPTLVLAMVIPSAAPVAALTAIFAVAYNRATDTSAGLVAGTTLLSILTMPPVIAWARTVFGFSAAG